MCSSQACCGKGETSITSPLWVEQKTSLGLDQNIKKENNCNLDVTAKRANVQDKDIQDPVQVLSIKQWQQRPSVSPEMQGVSHRPVHRPVEDGRPPPDVQQDEVDHMLKSDKASAMMLEKRFPIVG